MMTERLSSLETLAFCSLLTKVYVVKALTTRIRCPCLETMLESDWASFKQEGSSIVCQTAEAKSSVQFLQTRAQAIASLTVRKRQTRWRISGRSSGFLGDTCIGVKSEGKMENCSDCLAWRGQSTPHDSSCAVLFRGVYSSHCHHRYHHFLLQAGSVHPPYQQRSGPPPYQCPLL